MKEMKTLYLKQKDIQELAGNATLLLAYDDQAITVNDEVRVVNKDTQETAGSFVVDKVTIKRLGDMPEPATIVIAAADDIEQTLDPATPIKKIDCMFSPQDPKSAVANDAVNKSTYITEVKLYTDGGSRGNPGPAASGWVVYDMKDAMLKEGGFYLGRATNNVAEYTALKLGLQDAKSLGASRVQVYMDSLLIVNQMKGLYKIKNADLRLIYQEVRDSLAAFEAVTFTHVPRALNTEADRMVNETLDAVL